MENTRDVPGGTICEAAGRAILNEEYIFSSLPTPLGKSLKVMGRQGL